MPLSLDGTTGISTSGNITAAYLFGNASGLSGISSNKIFNGTSEANIGTSGGNANITVGGTSNVAVFTSTGQNLTGALSASGNVTGGNIITAGLISAVGNVTGGNVNTNTIRGTSLTLVSTGDLVLSATGNINANNDNINNLASPQQANDAATKQYVDDVAQGLNVHDAAQVATTTDLATTTGGTITYNNGTSGVGATLTTTGSFNLIDSVNVQASGTRILVKNEANAVTNGVYVWSNATAITRATDYDSIPEVEAGDFIFVTSGNIFGNCGFVQTSSPTAIGAAGNNISFTQFSGSGAYSAGTGLTLTGTTFSVNASQTQITTVGTLGSLAVTGNISGGNITTSGILSATGNVSGGNLNITGNIVDTGPLSLITGASGNVSLAPNGAIVLVATTTGANITGTLNATGNANVGNLGTGGAISATGNIAGGNLLTGGYVLATGNITGGNITTAGLISATGNISGGNLNVTGNIVDTGALTILTGSNGNLTLNAGTGFIIASSDILNGQANGTGNIGNSTGYFNTIFAKATSAQYADVAEKYVADRSYSPGTVLEIGGAAEVQETTAYASTKIAGVVSTAPALIMNSTESDANAVELALLGRVPCRVTGKINRGDLLTSSQMPGVATALAAQDYQPGCVIGKALEGHTGEAEGMIEVLVGRL